MDTRYFDLETAPAPREELEHLMPEFTANRNLKDPTKIAANIEEKREKWLADAALFATRGRILVASLELEPGKLTIVDGDGDERKVLLTLFDFLSAAHMGSQFRVYGWNLFEFDVPWFVRRCLIHKVQLPQGLVSFAGKWPTFAPWIIDLRTIWAFGNMRTPGSLDDISKAIGAGGKSGDGKEFARLWESQATRADAVAYAESEFQSCRELLFRLLLIGGPALFGRGMISHPSEQPDEPANYEAAMEEDEEPTNETD